METLLNNRIYIALSRWLAPLEEHKGGEDVYTSSDEDSAPIPVTSGLIGGATFKFGGTKAGASMPFGKKKAIPTTRRKHKQKANPNAFFIHYAKLLDDPLKTISSTEVPLLCSKCSAVANSVNSNEEEDNWVCGFCDTENAYPKGVEPKLEGPNVRYTLGPGEPPKASQPPGYIIIIDKSGSMSVTVAGGKSALQVLIEAIKNLMKEIITKNPNARIGLILVDKKVELLGDCTSPSKTINDVAILGSEDKLKALANEVRANFFKEAASHSIGRLTEKIEKIEGAGMTALGPSIVCGLEILKDFSSGKIMIFTDGLSNVGVGDIEPENNSVKAKEKEYYFKWAKQAREQGTAINFFAIANSQFDVGLYNPVAEETEGNIYWVDPNKILDEIGLPEESKQIGIDAEVTVILPRVLKFWRIIEIGAQVSGNKFRKCYGSLTEKTKDIMHFVVNPEGMSYMEAQYLKNLPAQVKVEWRGLDGKDYLSVSTQRFPVIARRPKEADPEKLKELMGRLSRDMALQGKQDKVEVELTDMLNEYLNKPKSEVEENLKKQAVEQRANVISSKTSTTARTVLFTKKFKPSTGTAATVKFTSKL